MYTLKQYYQMFKITKLCYIIYYKNIACAYSLFFSAYVMKIRFFSEKENRLTHIYRGLLKSQQAAKITLFKVILLAVLECVYRTYTV